ncbi:MAG: 2-isopropylmalate synthase [Peptococcaceae bacterium]|nr:2-isopropylmalate synthase [Peptococcaceae bacterium]
MPSNKYCPFHPIPLKDRQWPGKTLTAPPLWCSVDLRDGNQSLPIPMSVEEKLEMFKLLHTIGFKEIEVGFPSASPTEYAFLRRLINDNLIPDDVTVQVLVQSREDLIRQTFECLRGVKQAIVHLYNSTSTLQRRVVFKATREEILNIALKGARLIKQYRSQTDNGTHIRCQYSPESFTGTELDFALSICETVLDEWQASPDNPTVINLPSTVELATPNIYADQIEWFSRHLRDRSRVILSLHPHNDRGTAVAAAELAMLAGADRLEGSLFGNGERTGNVDIITLALNMFTQGIDPRLDFSDITHIKEIYERCTRMTVHERQPYTGELVYTAFSGSHQDAISKGLAAQSQEQNDLWQVPYLPIDPRDVGRQYEPIIRINGQSGKGGVAFIMETSFGYKLPKPMHAEFGQIVVRASDASGSEITPDTLLTLFKNEYVDLPLPYRLGKSRLQEIDTANEDETLVDFQGTVFVHGQEKEISGQGNGPLDAFFHALAPAIDITGYKFLSYDQHALGSGSDSRAIAYIRLEDRNSRKCFGVGTSKNISKASMRALLSAINRLLD